MGEIGRLIKKARKARGWRQGDLAWALGVDASAVSHYETGRRLPDIETFRLICETLGDGELWIHAGPLIDHTPHSNARIGLPIPLVGHVGDGHARLALDEKGHPENGRAEEMVPGHAGVKDAHAYAVKMRGHSMAPAIEDGDLLIVSPRVRIRSGDVAIIRSRDSHIYCKLYFRKGKLATLQSVNTANPPESLPEAEILIKHRVVEIRRH